MSRFSEIASLFAAMASNIETQDSTASNEIDRSISNLYLSLNPSEVPRTRVLDTALSLMCFPAPQVYDSVIGYTLRAIVTVLSSSIECKVSKVNKDQALIIGGSIETSGLTNIMEWSVDILRKLEGCKGDLCALLVYSVIRLAAFAPPPLQYAIKSKPVIENKFKDGRPYSAANLVCHLPNNIGIRIGQIPLRLLLWHLDPKILKQDVSEILQEVTERPFLSLSTEFYERMDWRSKITCLVISPSVFVEARALLHNWFLVTGFALIMELQTQIVVQLMDITSRPMWWGLSMEVGSKLPFSHAYFPNNQSFRIFSGSISQEYFQQLLNKLIRPISLVEGHLPKSSMKAATNITLIDHKSSWAMAMSFPGWFSFASVLLFYDNIRTDSCYSGFIPGLAKPYLLHDVEIPCSAGAARYIAWILNPINEAYQDLLLDYLGKVSELWICSSNKSNKVARGHMKEAKRVKLHNKDDIAFQALDSRTVFFWLKEFKEMYIRYSETKVVSSTYEGLRIHQSLLLQKIPLGILIGYLNHLNAVGCAMLLHYAAIGTVEKLSETQNLTKNLKLKCGRQVVSVTWTEGYTRAEAVAGCKLVFEMVDVIETISPSLFETEEDGLSFLFQVKSKTGDYLFQCIKRLLQVQDVREDIQMRKDLFSRVIHWRRQGRDVFQNNKDFDRVCDSLKLQ